MGAIPRKCSQGASWAGSGCQAKLSASRRGAWGPPWGHAQGGAEPSSILNARDQLSSLERSARGKKHQKYIFATPGLQIAGEAGDGIRTSWPHAERAGWDAQAAWAGAPPWQDAKRVRRRKMTSWSFCSIPGGIEETQGFPREERAHRGPLREAVSGPGAACFREGLREQSVAAPSLETLPASQSPSSR